MLDTVPIVQATRLLRSDLTLTQVAFDAGFADAAHMTRSFKAACGMTLSRLRQSLLLRAGDAHRPS